jgi:hypothetical protein
MSLKFCKSRQRNIPVINNYEFVNPHLDDVFNERMGIFFPWTLSAKSEALWMNPRGDSSSTRIPHPLGLS